MRLIDCYLALITGATSPIGQALALYLSKQGIPLLLTGRDLSILEKLKATLPQVEILPLDLNTDTKPVVEWIRKRKPNLIINNAGAGLYGKALDHPPAEQLQLFDLNGKIPLEITLAGIEVLEAEQRYGTILNVASAAGLLPFPHFSVYSSAKAAMISYSLSLDAEYKEKNIRVLAACPGMVATSFQKRASKGFYDKKPLFSMSSFKAAAHIVHQIEKEIPCYVFGPLTRYLIGFMRLLPLSLQLKMGEKSLKKRQFPLSKQD